MIAGVARRSGGRAAPVTSALWGRGLWPTLLGSSWRQWTPRTNLTPFAVLLLRHRGRTRTIQRSHSSGVKARSVLRGR